MIFYLWILISSIIACILSDVLVFIEHRDHNRQWLTDKMPSGIFWKPRYDIVNLRGSLAYNRLILSWLFVTPKWVKADAKSLSILWIIRSIVAINAALVIVAFAWFS